MKIINISLAIVTVLICFALSYMLLFNADTFSQVPTTNKKILGVITALYGCFRLYRVIQLIKR